MVEKNVCVSETAENRMGIVGRAGWMMSGRLGTEPDEQRGGGQRDTLRAPGGKSLRWQLKVQGLQEITGKVEATNQNSTEVEEGGCGTCRI